MEGFILYIVIGIVWSLHRLVNKRDQSEVEEEIKDEYSPMMADIYSHYSQNLKHVIFVIYALFWPINMFYYFKRIIVKLFKK